MFAHQRSGFMRAMSDAGLKPTVVHHNLTPAELYEQVWSVVVAPIVAHAIESCHCHWLPSILHQLLVFDKIQHQCMPA